MRYMAFDCIDQSALLTQFAVKPAVHARPTEDVVDDGESCRLRAAYLIRARTYYYMSLMGVLHYDLGVRQVINNGL